MPPEPDNAPCIFGEVLFDHFPDGSAILGGAPFNVAWNLQALGEPPLLISRVGRDPQGDAVLAAMRRWGMRTDGVQRDPERPTGRVNVKFIDGEPGYDIQSDCAYDAIEAPALGTCAALYHGSLALRSGTTARALEAIQASRPRLVFIDVNLRPPWWQRDQLQALLQRAHWVKLNEAELRELAAPCDDDAALLRQLLGDYALDGVIVTRGAAGACLLAAGGEYHEVAPSSHGAVVDTVGAGDAFASVMLIGLRRAWPLSLALQRAQAFAQQVIGRRGATVADAGFYRAVRASWDEVH
ncbi:MAG: hypothetical protein KDI01_04455 [Halioglobus sp.]|nr:hypothetical protein [Halioglobus sp.]